MIGGQCLPPHHEMTEADQDLVVSVIRAAAQAVQADLPDRADQRIYLR